jgi:hypothetical protein
MDPEDGIEDEIRTGSSHGREYLLKSIFSIRSIVTGGGIEPPRPCGLPIGGPLVMRL